jgi:H+/Cl- antiporter ClcA
VRPLRRRSRDRLAAVASLVIGLALAAFLVAGEHSWDSDQSMPIGVGKGIHPSDLLAVVPLVVGFGLAAWFAWRSRRPDAAHEVSPGVATPHRR